MEKYKLYVGRRLNVPAEIKYSFYNPAHNYILILHNGKIPKGFKAVPENLLSELSTDEKQWLISSKMQINAKYLKERQKEYTAVLDEFLTELDRQLKIEEEKGVKNGEKERAE